MDNEHLHISNEVKSSPLYSEDLAPIPVTERTWSMWDMASIWVGMAVCIPTYLLASYMIKSGLSWLEALIIILLGNVIITIPMAMNGHAGVKYGVPFPVIGRAAFGVRGVHIPSIIRGIVACGWFGIQTWIGGLAIYSIWHAVMGTEGSTGLDIGKFIGFGLFWLLNVYFIWKGTESIKWLEKFAAPILIGIGIALIIWGASAAGGFGIVLQQSDQLSKPGCSIIKNQSGASLVLNPIRNKEGKIKASEYNLIIDGNDIDEWQKIDAKQLSLPLPSNVKTDDIAVKYRKLNEKDLYVESSASQAVIDTQDAQGFGSRIWSYLLWLTAMVGFWATMAISIADITRFTATQKNQVYGQFIGLPGTMALFSFVGIFVTCAALINFQDILVADDAPWDPVTLLSKFSNPVVVIIAQLCMIIATLSTNIAANVIAPANAFSNVSPSRISFVGGGMIAAILGIVICPWLLMDEISGLLIFVSGFLGPVLGILICDYYLISKRQLNINHLFQMEGLYSYSSGFHLAAFVAFVVGICTSLLGLMVPAVSFLYTLSWFTGFGVAFVTYYIFATKRHV